MLISLKMGRPLIICPQLYVRVHIKQSIISETNIELFHVYG